MNTLATKLPAPSNVFLALLLGGAAITSLFYTGLYLPYLSITLACLMVALSLALVSSYSGGIRLPLSATLLSLMALWLWSGIGYLWSSVPHTTAMAFWLLGALPLAFLAYTLSASRQQMWRFMAAALLLLGLFVALTGLYHGLVLENGMRHSFFINQNNYAAYLNLLALPTAGYLLMAYRDRRLARASFLGAAYFVLVLAMAYVNGRGAMISFGLGLAVIMVVAWRRAPRPALVLVLALSGLAFMGAHTQLGLGGIVDRMGTIADPSTSGASRFMIWQGSLEMLQERPWLGTGLGTYFLLWPPHRHQQDASAGQHVHNDYLELWIETGVPGVMLVLALLVSILVLFIRTLARKALTPSQGLELSALFAGLLAIAAHSALTFNLYLLPILVMTGLVLGRFHHLATHHSAIARHLPIAARLTPKGWTALVIVLCLFPLNHVATSGLAAYYSRQALQHLIAGEVTQADAVLRKSERLASSSDAPKNLRAKIYTRVLEEGLDLQGEDRARLFTEAHKVLNQVAGINAYRPELYYNRARLWASAPDLAGADWRERVREDYQRAIDLNPLFHEARLAYAKFLQQQGDSQRALEIFKGGLYYWYSTSIRLLEYYVAAAKALRQAGETTRAEQVEDTVDKAVARLNAYFGAGAVAVLPDDG